MSQIIPKIHFFCANSILSLGALSVMSASDFFVNGLFQEIDRKSRTERCLVVNEGFSKQKEQFFTKFTQLYTLTMDDFQSSEEVNIHFIYSISSKINQKGGYIGT